MRQSHTQSDSAIRFDNSFRRSSSRAHCRPAPPWHPFGLDNPPQIVYKVTHAIGRPVQAPLQLLEGLSTARPQLVERSLSKRYCFSRLASPAPLPPHHSSFRPPLRTRPTQRHPCLQKKHVAYNRCLNLLSRSTTNKLPDTTHAQKPFSTASKTRGGQKQKVRDTGFWPLVVS